MAFALDQQDGSLPGLHLIENFPQLRDAVHHAPVDGVHGIANGLRHNPELRPVHMSLRLELRVNLTGDVAWN